jgi:hypothetical protein
MVPVFQYAHLVSQKSDQNAEDVKRLVINVLVVPHSVPTVLILLSLNQALENAQRHHFVIMVNKNSMENANKFVMMVPTSKMVHVFSEDAQMDLKIMDLEHVP